MVQGKINWLTEADTPTIRMGATPSGLTNAHLHQSTIPHIFYRPYVLPAAQPTASKYLYAKLEMPSFTNTQVVATWTTYHFHKNSDKDLTKIQ